MFVSYFMSLYILFSSEAAVARQAKLQAVNASSSSRAPRPVQGKPAQPQNAAAGIQGELVSISTFQPNHISTCVLESVTSELTKQSSIQKYTKKFI
jgi:hypothetical protein